MAKSDVNVSKVSDDDFLTNLLSCNYKPPLKVDPLEMQKKGEKIQPHSKEIITKEIQEPNHTEEISKVTDDDFLTNLLSCNYKPPLKVDPLEMQKKGEKIQPQVSHLKEIITKEITEPNHSDEIVTKEITEPNHSKEIVMKEIQEPKHSEEIVVKEIQEPKHSEDIIDVEILEPNLSEKNATKEIVEPKHSKEVIDVEILKPNHSEEIEVEILEHSLGTGRQETDKKDPLNYEAFSLKPTNPGGFHPKPKATQVQSQDKQIQGELESRSWL